MSWSLAPDLSRRAFLAGSARCGSCLWLVLHAPRFEALAADDEKPIALVLKGSDWKTVEAIVGRMIPTDDEAGAIEVGCVSFIDGALANANRSVAPVYEAGLPGIQSVSQKRFGRPFLDLHPEEQDEILRSLESGEAEGWPPGDVSSREFFETVRLHTILGYLADPKYAGNRGRTGWGVIGYPGRPHHAGVTAKQLRGEQRLPTVWESPR